MDMFIGINCKMIKPQEFFDASGSFFCIKTKGQRGLLGPRSYFEFPVITSNIPANYKFNLFGQ